MTEFYLETPCGKDRLEDDLNAEDIACEVVAALLNDQEPWCRLYAQGNPRWVTQWTVMERSESLTPTKIAVREFDGSVSIFDNSRRE